MRKYRLILQTAQRLYVVAAANQINELQPLLARWFVSTIAGRSIYDDQIKGLSLYVYDPMTNSYQRRNTTPVGSREAAISAVMGFVGIM